MVQLSANRGPCNSARRKMAASSHQGLSMSLVLSRLPIHVTNAMLMTWMYHMRPCLDSGGDWKASIAVLISLRRHINVYIIQVLIGQERVDIYITYIEHIEVIP